MFSKTTPEKAINIGHAVVHVPMVFIAIGLLGYLSSLSLVGSFPWLFFPGAIFSFALAIFYRSFMVVKWKLWAFENVRNVQELKKKAYRAYLILEEDNFYEKLIIWTPSDKIKWETLREKLDRPDVHEEDLLLPPVTEIYYSKGKTLLLALASLGFMVLGIYMILSPGTSTASGVVLMLLGGLGAFWQFKKVTDRNPQLIIDDKGIRTASGDFFAWPAINGEDVIFRDGRRVRKSYLIFDHRGRQEKIQITDYAVSRKRLAHLLRTYRIRHDKKA